MTTTTVTPSSAREAIRPPAPAASSSFAMVACLGGMAALSGLLLAITYQATFARIQSNKEQALKAAIFMVLPGADEQRSFEVKPDGTMVPLEGEGKGVEKVYAGFSGGRFVGVAMEASAQGYGDMIRVLYGYDPESEQIVGFKVLDSKETPGLGDKIAKEPFLQNFQGLDVKLDADGASLVHAVETVKNGEKEHAWEIDGISGATISSKAVGRMLQESTSRMLPLIRKQLGVLRGER